MQKCCLCLHLSLLSCLSFFVTLESELFFFQCTTLLDPWKKQSFELLVYWNSKEQGICSALVTEISDNKQNAKSMLELLVKC